MADQTLKVLFQLQDQMSGPLSGITNALQSLQKLAVSVGAALGVAFGLRALIQLGKDAVSAAEQITSLSRQTGISIANIQKLGAAADAVNMPMSQLSTAFRMLSEHAEMAAEGNKRQIELFNKLGISVRDNNGIIKNGEQLFGEFADVIAATKNPTVQMALAMEVLGRSGTLALPMLKLGAAGIKKMGDDAERAGMVMSKDVVQALNNMGRELSAVSTIMVNMAGNALAKFADIIPQIVGFIAKYADVIAGIMGGAKLLFDFMISGFKFLGEVIASTLALLNDGFHSALGSMVEEFKPVIQGWIDLFHDFGLISGEGWTKATKAMENYIASSKQIDPAKSLAEWKTSIKIAGEDLSHETEVATANAQKFTKETGEGIKTQAEAVNTYLGDIKKVNQAISASSGQAAKDVLAMSQTISGGLELAMQDIVDRTSDWRKAWTNMFDGIQKGMTDALDTFILKGGKMKDLMKNIFDSIEQSFVHMLTSMLTQALLKEFLGLFMNNGTTPQGVMGNSVASVDNRFGGSSTTGAFSGGGGGIGLGGLGNTYLFGGPKEIMETGENGEQIGTGTFEAGSGLTLGGALAGIGGTLAGLSMEQQAQHGRVNVGRSVAGGALAGLSTGAMIGSVVPGIGTVAGAAIGAIAGAVQGFVSGKSAKRKQQKAEEEAEQARQEQEAALRAQARQLIMGDIRAKYGGGLADVSAVTDIGAIMSNGISDATLDQFGGAANVVSQQGAIGQSINNIHVSSPITVNATLAGSYDTQVLAQDLGIQLAASIRSAASGAGI